MAGTKHNIKALHPEYPVYPTEVAARLLGIHSRTLRIYENEGLVKPHQSGLRKMYSDNDVKWIECLRSMIHDQGLSIPGIKKLLEILPCWEITDCPEEICTSCPAKVDKVLADGMSMLSGKELSVNQAETADGK